MTRLSTNDANLGQKLESATEPLEILDARGAVVGRFLPGPLRAPLLRPEDDFPYTEEELTRREQEIGGRTLTEIWRDLGRT